MLKSAESFLWQEHRSTSYQSHRETSTVAWALFCLVYVYQGAVTCHLSRVENDLGTAVSRGVLREGLSRGGVSTAGGLCFGNWGCGSAVQGTCKSCKPLTGQPLPAAMPRPLQQAETFPWLGLQGLPWEASHAGHLRPVKIDFSMGSKHLPFCLHEEIQSSPRAGSCGDHGNLLCGELPWIAALLARAESESLQPSQQHLLILHCLASWPFLLFCEAKHPAAKGRDKSKQESASH